MEKELMDNIRESLAEKRENLAAWIEETPKEKRAVNLGNAGEQEIISHLATLDQAGEQASQGTLGTCTVCHDKVNTGLLEMDYTCCVCLDHLSSDQARSLEFEIELAQAVQRSLLPE